MSLVEHPIAIGPKTADGPFEGQPECGGDPADRGQAHPANPATLDVRHDGPADSCSSGQIRLSPAPAMPKRANQPTKPHIVHSRTMTIRP